MINIRSIAYILFGLWSYGYLFTAESKEGILYIQNYHHALQFECAYIRNGQQEGPVTVYKNKVLLGSIQEISEVRVRRYGAWLGAGAEYYSFPDQLGECKRFPNRDCSLTIHSSIIKGWDITAEPQHATEKAVPLQLKRPIDFFKKAKEYEEKSSQRISPFSLGQPEKVEPRHLLNLGKPYTAKGVEERQQLETKRIQTAQLSDEMHAYVTAMLADAVKYALDLLRIPMTSPEYQKMLIEFRAKLHPERVAHGKQIACDIVMHNLQSMPDTNKYLDAIVDLMWYLYSIALEKGQAYDEGTFVIQDNDPKIYTFLLNYAKIVNPEEVAGTERDAELMLSYKNIYAYPRTSTHFKDVKEQYNARHYGIDIRHRGYSIAEALLPAQKSHVLFGDLYNGYIFIKLENVGIAAPSVAQHALELITAQLRKFLPGITPAQYNELMLYYIGTDDDPLYRKERVPRKVLEECWAIVDKENISPEQKQRIKLQFGHQGIQGIFKEIHNEASPLSPDQKQELQDSLTKLEKTEGLDHQDIRYGREVIISRDRIAQGCR